jgi:hypothetical protein
MRSRTSRAAEAPPDAALIARAELTALGVQEFHGEKATWRGERSWKIPGFYQKYGEVNWDNWVLGIEFMVIDVDG